MRIYQVDSFADKKFEGNPAGVCILSEPADEIWMQNVAMEMNLSETAFLYREGEGFNLRWFTPETEVDLCGHATLASAHILWETGVLDKDTEAVFFTKSGKLTARLNGDLIVLNFPTEADTPIDMPAGLTEAINAPILYVGRNRLDYIIEVESEATVRTLNPDIEMLKKIDTRGFIVTSAATDSKYDFVSRFFAPGAGIMEDPVTGSAHCCLAPYWSKRLGKKEMTAYQASKRGGTLRVTLCGERTLIGGKAITVLTCEI